jgi:GTP-binding protein
LFIDKAKIFIKAGNGGDGAVSFRREKYVPDGGPDGGDGGRGGSVIFEVDLGIRTLMDFKYQKKYKAESGGNGSKKRRTGKDGEDIILKVPPGTLIKDEETGLIIADLKNEGDRVIAARGGRGGKGNSNFATAVRQAPSFAKPGTEGEERSVILELKMIADAGLLGFPNVGKSTFLSIVTKAKPKIANYHFTTLTPNLGVVQTKFGQSFVLADIPGIIEGASEGIGLGHEFLRHVERTKVLIHIVDISGMEGRDPIEDFEKINEELKLYNEKLSQRPQIVVANKIDILQDENKFEEFATEIEKRGYKVFKMSAATRQGVDDVIEYVAKIIEETPDVELFTEDEILDISEQTNEPEELQIEVDENGVYIVTGKALRNILYSVNFEDMESIQYFQKSMESRGIFDRLREMGIEDGDTVKIYELEFEFYN